ncbi:protein MAINTENANCE OF MERISTEMS-like [Chenopodium quinoa]|uniref:protein MAINTENANCE OF MERISTEMS-like n=1 Tax=Chenopodium quinoa TaxID=63459 RepID=UPI000B78ABEA|nr:protein MAINTENANCE OF MERISTEMS-like [Chenopodium quinoa]
MPGGPSDGSVIPSYGGHVARRIWEGKPRGVLKCYNLTNACEALVGWKKTALPFMQARIDATGLGHLPSCMFKHIDMPLISAFVERWQPDTNSFHLPFGEMTIMLHDVWQILHIPVDGCLNTSQSSSKDLIHDMSELLGRTPDELVVPPTPHWSDDGVSIESILALCRDGTLVGDIDTKFTSWMFLMLGSSLFVDKNESRIRPSSILEVNYDCDLGKIPKYAWGAATLAFLYRQLGVASRGACDGIAGCLTLLQAWIYEYFPCFRPHQKRLTCGPNDPRSLMWSTKMEDNSEARLRSIRTHLDYLTALEVNWLPYGPNPASIVPRTLFLGWLRYQDIIEPYMPERVLRQLGYKQVIPSSISRPEKAYRPEDSKLYNVEFPVMATESTWQIFPRGSKLILSEFQRNSNPSACSPEYDDWFFDVSHRYLVDEDCSMDR